MIEIPFPRLLDPTTMQEIRRITPISASVNLNITPLSTATLVVDIDEDIPVRSWIEMYTVNGSAGIYRVREISIDYGDFPRKTIQLEHGACTFGDIYEITSSEREFAVAAFIAACVYHANSPIDEAPNAPIVKWAIGNVDDPTNKFILSLSMVTRLTTLVDMIEQNPDYMLTFDQTTVPWKIGVEKLTPSVSAEGRLSRNIRSAKVTIDTSNLCNRSIAYRFNEDAIAPVTWIQTDADSCNSYFCTRNYFQVEDGLSDAQINKMANNYLQRHKNPSYSVEIDGYDLSHITGENIDSFKIGKLYRLSLPDYNTTIEQYITNLSWNDVYNDSAHVTITLAEKPEKIVQYIHRNNTTKVAKKKG